ncbi:MAG: hypothetical protein JW783_06890 [Bacteroidales bacterium]|nr:hypothetical protein [Bacteroidales bacterium]MBN2748164.1 hypothetical protein [Bacteroidales bacterium]
MKKLYSLKTFTAVFLLGLSSCLYAQTGKAEFEKIFEKETGEIESAARKNFKNVKRFSYYPDTLPSWFFSPPQGLTSEMFAVGISDPDQDSTTAINQAFHRAKALAILFGKSKMQYFRDVYTSEQQAGKYTDYRQRFDTYFKVSSMAVVSDDCFSLISSHFTRYNEAIVLIRYTPANKGNKQLVVQGNALFIEAQVEDAFEVQAEYELQTAINDIGGKPETTYFMFRQKGNKTYSESRYLNAYLQFPVFVYKYVSPNYPSGILPLICYSGLWSRYSSELIQSLILTTESNKKTVKNLGQQHNPENANLSREVAQALSTIYINGIEFENDTLRINFKFDNLSLNSEKP